LRHVVAIRRAEEKEVWNFSDRKWTKWDPRDCEAIRKLLWQLCQKALKVIYFYTHKCTFTTSGGTRSQSNDKPSVHTCTVETGLAKGARIKDTSTKELSPAKSINQSFQVGRSTKAIHTLHMILRRIPSLPNLLEPSFSIETMAENDKNAFERFVIPLAESIGWGTIHSNVLATSK